MDGQGAGAAADRESGGPVRGGDLLAAISNRIVRLHKEVYGKGPTRARTLYQGDVVVVILRGGFTTVEQTLHRAGRDRAVVRQRAAVHEVVKNQFIGAVEELTGRRVIGFMSASQQDPDMAAEIFLLEPEEGESPSRSNERSSI